IKGEISVFTFNSLGEMIKFWQNLIDNWFKKFKEGDYNVNCYQAAHVWENLLYPETERLLWKQLKEKKIKSNILITGNTLLDKFVVKFYSKMNVNMQIKPSNSSFDKSYYVGTYGDLVIQTQYPENIVKEFDNFFKKHRTAQDLDLAELSDIVNKKREVKLTVIKNLAMAKQINNSILSELD
ncbi:MAG: hypothetical protein WC475_05160, partial [Candidatus Paceibacterota bacterium]